VVRRHDFRGLFFGLFDRTLVLLNSMVRVLSVFMCSSYSHWASPRFREVFFGFDRTLVLTRDSMISVVFSFDVIQRHLVSLNVVRGFGCIFWHA